MLVGADSPEAEALADQIRTHSAALHSLTAELVSMLSRFDAIDGWQGFGIRSLPSWLSIDAGFALNTGHRLAGLVEPLQVLPLTAADFADGRLSMDKTWLVCRVATPDDESIWVEIARQASAAQLSRIVRDALKVQRQDDDPDDPAAVEAKRGVWFYWDDEGFLHLSAVLDAEDGSVVLAAIEAVTGNRPAKNAEEGNPTYAGARADALATICAHANATLPDDLVSDPGLRHIFMIVPDPTERRAARLADAETPLPEWAAELMTCAGIVQELYTVGGLPIDAGAAVYTPNRALRRAVQFRDKGCQHPACAMPASRCEVHHIVPWPAGRTVLWNLCLLCRYHHRQFHLRAFTITRLADGTLTFRTPAGTMIGAAKLKAPEGTFDFEQSVGPCRAEQGGEHYEHAWAVNVITDACHTANTNQANAPPSRT